MYGSGDTASDTSFAGGGGGGGGGSSGRRRSLLAAVATAIVTAVDIDTVRLLFLTIASAVNLAVLLS